MNDRYALDSLDRRCAVADSDTIPYVRRPYSDAPRSTPMDEPSVGLLIDYWHMLRRHIGLLLIIICLGVLLSISLTLPQTPVYQAHTMLEIQNINENFLNMRDVSPTGRQDVFSPIDSDLQTQVTILQSEAVVRPVIATLKLADRLRTQKRRWRISAWRGVLRTPDPKSVWTEEDVLPMVTGSLKARPRANTRLIELAYDSTDPSLAADVANTLAAEFIRQNLESRSQTARKTGEWLNGQMEEARIKLETSEARLNDYARAAGLLFTSEKDNVAEEKLRQLQQEYSRAQADRVVRQSRYELVATASPDSLPEVLDDPTLKDYQLKLTDLRRQLAELSSTLLPAHPALKKVQAQVSALETAWERARSNVIRRIQNEFESARHRESLLAAEYKTQTRTMTEQAAKVTHYSILKREVDNNRQIYDSMLQHVKEAGIASALRASNIRVIDAARPPTRPYKPNLLLNAMLGAFGGVLCGFGCVIMRERADRSISRPGEVHLCADLPELGVIPSARSERSGFLGVHRYRPIRNPKIFLSESGQRSSLVELATCEQRPSLLAESFRSTLVSLLLMYLGQNGKRPRVIVLTSANPLEGKTTVASNMALALAEIGRRVLLIDADLRQPRLHEIFKVSNGSGLSNLLDGTKEPEQLKAMVAATGYSNLDVLPAGPVSSSIANLLHSPRALDLLNRARNEFDMVIIDTPPMLQIPDARVLGRFADGVILVVRSARTTRETATAASQRLTADGTKILGTILNDWDPKKASHSGYEYGRRPYA